MTVMFILATFAPYERLFSSAGRIVNKTRSSLEPNTVHMPVCLRSWSSVNIYAKSDFFISCFYPHFD